MICSDTLAKCSMSIQRSNLNTFLFELNCSHRYIISDNAVCHPSFLITVSFYSHNQCDQFPSAIEHKKMLERRNSQSNIKKIFFHVFMKNFVQFSGYYGNW